MIALRNDPIFADFFRSAPSVRAAWQPWAVLKEEDDAFALEMEVPGIAPDSLEVEFDKGVLTLRGEARRGRFERYARVGNHVDADAIEALLTQGVLTVRVPKQAPESTVRRIAVQTG